MGSDLDDNLVVEAIRRQAASCLYGLAPLLHDILTGKLDQLELMEASDSDEDVDLDFVGQVRTDIAAVLEQARNLVAQWTTKSS